VEGGQGWWCETLAPDDDLLQMVLQMNWGHLEQAKVPLFFIFSYFAPDAPDDLGLVGEKEK
jgi:hypothetical protein